MLAGHNRLIAIRRARERFGLAACGDGVHEDRRVDVIERAGGPVLHLVETVLGTVLAALITAATRQQPYFVGKPNPMMFRSALNRISAHSENTVMIGDRIDTGMVAGIDAGLDTVLALTGSTRRSDPKRYPYQPAHVLDSIADAIELVC